MTQIALAKGSFRAAGKESRYIAIDADIVKVRSLNILLSWLLIVTQSKHFTQILQPAAPQR